MRFEGDDEFALGQVKDKFREALLAIDAHLELAW
jgi:hypothetical protein